MLTKNDIVNAQNGDYSSFFEAVKKTLEEKLENNSFIKNSMSKIEYYKNLTRSLAESKCEEVEDDEDEDEDKVEDKVDDVDDTDDDEDKVEDDDEDDDDELDESLSYDDGLDYLSPLRETKGRRIRLKLVEKETLEGKLEDFDEDYVYLGKTRCLPDGYWIDGMNVPWKNIKSMEFI